MYKFNNCDELCIIRYNNRWIAMTKHGDITKQVTANYDKCDGSYETLVEAVHAIVGVVIPSEEVLLDLMYNLVGFRVITFNQTEMAKWPKTI